MKELLEDSFRAAVAAANPLQILPRAPAAAARRTDVRRRRGQGGRSDGARGREALARRMRRSKESR